MCLLSFSIKTPHFLSQSSQWECVLFFSFFLPFFFPNVRNRTLASMWFELGPLKLWRTPRMTWGTCRPNSNLLNGGEKNSQESSEIFGLRSCQRLKQGGNRKLNESCGYVIWNLSLLCHTLVQTWAVLFNPPPHPKKNKTTPPPSFIELNFNTLSWKLPHFLVCSIYHHLGKAATFAVMYAWPRCAKRRQNGTPPYLLRSCDAIVHSGWWDAVWHSLGPIWEMQIRRHEKYFTAMHLRTWRAI